MKFDDNLEIENIEVTGNRITNTLKVSIAGHGVIGRLAINLLEKDSLKFSKMKSIKIKDLKNSQFEIKEGVEVSEFLSSKELVETLIQKIQFIHTEEKEIVVKGKDTQNEKIKLVKEACEENAIVSLLVERYLEELMEYNNLTPGGKIEKDTKEETEKQNILDKSEE